ncbi:hypothetical protein BJI47_04675 [Rhodococcus sp. 1168]|nr:hypothetical protein BJI47_04675 [Rhodococcus sp. 1168]
MTVAVRRLLRVFLEHLARETVHDLKTLLVRQTRPGKSQQLHASEDFSRVQEVQIPTFVQAREEAYEETVRGVWVDETHRQLRTRERCLPTVHRIER